MIIYRHNIGNIFNGKVKICKVPIVHEKDKIYFINIDININQYRVTAALQLT